MAVDDVMMTQMTGDTLGCSCGDGAPHVVARRCTIDGIPVEIWHDGAITGRMGRAIPGVPVARPRSTRGTNLARSAAALVSGQVEICTLAEVPRLVDVARRVARRGGTPGDLRAEAIQSRDAHGRRSTSRMMA